MFLLIATLGFSLLRYGVISFGLYPMRLELIFELKFDWLDFAGDKKPLLGIAGTGSLF